LLGASGNGVLAGLILKRTIQGIDDERSLTVNQTHQGGLPKSQTLLAAGTRRAYTLLSCTPAAARRSSFLGRGRPQLGDRFHSSGDFKLFSVFQVQLY
jgi:hypothetical protein